MNISKKILWWAALGSAFLVVTYQYAYMQGSINTAQTLDEIGHLQILRTEAVLNVLDAIKGKTILPSTENSAASVVNSVFLDLIVIKKSLSQKQANMICNKVNDSEVILLLKSTQLYGDPKLSWDQAGVKGIVEMCQDN